MTTEAFDAAFRPSIGVCFNWQRFVRERWKVTHRVLTSVPEFAHCFLPWYIGRNGGEVSFRVDGARPIRFAEIPKVLSQLDARHQDGIRRYVKAFQVQEDEAAFPAPVYSLSGSLFIAMDANHRLSALTLVSKRIKVDVYEVLGPLDADCLLDLAVVRG